jgi:hypothetical protein
LPGPQCAAMNQSGRHTMRGTGRKRATEVSERDVNRDVQRWLDQRKTFRF